MGYFSNGTEGMLYEERYCSNCLHYGDDGANCPILMIHSFHNGVGIAPDATEDDKRVASILNAFIPRGTTFNEKCAMHTPEAQFPLLEDEDMPRDRVL